MEDEGFLSGIGREPDGAIRFDLSPQERLLLATFLDGYDDFVADGAPGAHRLYPPAYPDDAEAEADYRGLVRDELVDGRRANVAVVRRTLHADRLDEAEAHAWLIVTNDLRLVLGTRLGVTEAHDEQPTEGDPEYPTWVGYMYLGWVADQFVGALAAGLD